MAELWRDQKEAGLWYSKIPFLTGDHQKTARSLFLLTVFALMALPWVIDLLH